MRSKICTKCQELKELNEFYKNKVTRDGYNSWCKVCTNIQARKRNKQRYQMIKGCIREVKEFTPCHICGIQYHYAAMCFHHKDPKTKGFDVSQGYRLGKNLERIKEEIKKCNVYCANCHNILHYKHK